MKSNVHCILEMDSALQHDDRLSNDLEHRTSAGWATQMRWRSADHGSAGPDFGDRVEATLHGSALVNALVPTSSMALPLPYCACSREIVSCDDPIAEGTDVGVLLSYSGPARLRHSLQACPHISSCLQWELSRMIETCPILAQPPGGRETSPRVGTASCDTSDLARTVVKS